MKIQVDDADENGFTALSEASAAGHVGSIQLLLSEPWGADPNTVGRFKRTPLWRATFANQREAALALLEGGADPRLRGRFVPWSKRPQLLLSTTISIIITMIALEKSVSQPR